MFFSSKCFSHLLYGSIFMEHIICMLRYARSYIHNEMFVKCYSVTLFMHHYSARRKDHLIVVVYTSFSWSVYLRVYTYVVPRCGSRPPLPKKRTICAKSRIFCVFFSRFRTICVFLVNWYQITWYPITAGQTDNPKVCACCKGEASIPAQIACHILPAQIACPSCWHGSCYARSFYTRKGHAHFASCTFCVSWVWDFPTLVWCGIFLRVWLWCADVVQ